MQLCEEKPCPFCFGVVDKWGIHPESCTAGGDKTLGHHILRNNLYCHGKRGGTVPILEAAGVLEVLGVGGDRGGPTRSHRAGTVRERPADVLSCHAQDLRTGTGALVQGGVALGRVALGRVALAHGGLRRTPSAGGSFW